MTDHTQTPDIKTKSNSAMIKQLVAVVLLLNLAVISIAGWSLYQSRKHCNEQAFITAQNLTHVLERYINGVLGKIETGLLAVATEAEKHMVHGTVDAKALAPYLQRFQKDLPDVDGYRLTNAQGEYIYGIGVAPEKRISTADRDFFIRLRDNPDLTTTISKPLVSRISGKWVIIVAKRINRPDGSFAGVVTTPFSIEKLYQILFTIDVGKHGSIILRDETLKLAVRFPEMEGIGRIVGTKATRELQELVQNGKTAGTYQAHAPLDNVYRSYSFRKIAGQPFYIIVGLSDKDYLSGWRKELAQLSTLVGLFCLVTFLSAWRFYSDWKLRTSATMDLVQQELKYRTVADYAYAWEFWLSPEGSLIYSSPSCKRVTGYDSDAFFSNPALFRSIIHPHDQKLYAGHRQEAVSGISTHSLVTRIQHSDGSTRWIEHDCQPVYDQAGVFIGTRGSNRDVTERIQVQSALKENEYHFHQLFIQNWDAVMLLEHETFAVVDANPAFLSLFGYSLSELVSNGSWLLLAPETTQQFTQLFEEAILLGESFLEKGISICKDGTQLHISAKVKLIRLKEQNVVYCSIRNISDRIRMEKEKLEVQSKLIHANKMTSLGMLVSGMAHEINNPNQYILLNASILTGVWEDSSAILSRYHEQCGDFTLKGMTFSKALETVPRLLKAVTEGSHRINLIVKDLKDYSRDNSGKPKSHFDLNQITQTAVQILTHHIHKHTYNFQIDLSTAIPQVRGNAQQIEQVVINLITNALQALSDKTQMVHIATFYESDTDSVVLCVQDEGRGMSHEVMERITEPFFSTKLESGGTGLGLSISATLLKENGGTLDFQSKPDSGTVATIKLRAAETKPTPSSPDQLTQVEVGAGI